jgi:acyl-CoA dehydrogenase
VPHPRTDEQRELVSTVRDVLARHADVLPPPWETVVGQHLNRSLWESLAELGLLGVGVPEEHGGSGGALRDVCLVAEQMGAACARVPFVATAAVLTVGPPDADRIVDGSVVAVPAWETFAAAPIHSDGLRLSGSRVEGSLRAVAFGADADVLLAFAGDTAVLVDLHQPGACREQVATLDVMEPAADMTFTDVHATTIDPADFVPRALTLVAAELVGTGQRALDGAVEYAKQRRQFGRAIGSFQSIKHMLADRHVQLDSAQLLVDRAIDAVSEGQPEAPVAARTALLAATGAAHRAAGDALQTFGGIGFTWEHRSHVFLKRARIRRSLFGSPAAQLDALAANIFGDGSAHAPAQPRHETRIDVPT